MRQPAALQQQGLNAGAWLAAIIDNSYDAILSKTMDGIITSWNRAAEQIFGFSAEEAIGQPITIIIPEDRLFEEADILARIRLGERVERFQTMRRRRDGSLVAVSVTVSPVRDQHGVIQGASKILHDITEHKQADERRNLLLREMNHRIKNLFALTAGLVTVSARVAVSKEELAVTLSDRIASLARAHALTLPNPGRDSDDNPSTTLVALLNAILEPYPGQCTIEPDGDDMPIGTKALSSLALMLHEFTTNAAKYGALSSEAGRLTVRFSAVQDMLRLVWSEAGGPGGMPRTLTEGFGTRLEQASLRSLDATLEREWKPGGLEIVLSIPIHRTT